MIEDLGVELYDERLCWDVPQQDGDPILVHGHFFRDDYRPATPAEAEQFLTTLFPGKETIMAKTAVLDDPVVVVDPALAEIDNRNKAAFEDARERNGGVRGYVATTVTAIRGYGQRVAAFTRLDRAWAWGSRHVSSWWARSAPFRAWLMQNSGPLALLALGTETGQKVVMKGLELIKSALTWFCKPIMWVLDRVGRRDQVKVAAGLPATAASQKFAGWMMRASDAYDRWVLKGTQDVFNYINSDDPIIGTAKHGIMAGAAYMISTTLTGPLQAVFALICAYNVFNAGQAAYAAVAKKPVIVVAPAGAAAPVAGQA